MIYSVKTVYYDEFDKCDATKCCFVNGESAKEVMEQIESYYGEDNIEKVEIECISPYGFIEFEEGDITFEMLREKIKEDAIWQQKN